MSGLTSNTRSNNPAVSAQLLACVHAAPTDAGLDGAGAAFRPATTMVVGLVGVEFACPLRGRPRPCRTLGTASKVGASMRLLCRLAGLRRTLRGVPRRSTTRWRFVPGLPRCVGSGPVPAPPFWPPQRRCPDWRGSSPGAPRPANTQAARGEGRPRRRPPARRATCASRSSPNTSPNRPTRVAASARECQSAGRP